MSHNFIYRLNEDELGWHCQCVTCCFSIYPLRGAMFSSQSSQPQPVTVIQNMNPSCKTKLIQFVSFYMQWSNKCVFVLTLCPSWQEDPKSTILMADLLGLHSRMFSGFRSQWMIDSSGVARNNNAVDPKDIILIVPSAPPSTPITSEPAFTKHCAPNT